MSGFIRPTQATLAAGFGVLALVACGTPDLATNLRPEGPPDVLTVMVLTDGFSANGGVPQETATFCRDDDDKVPTFIGQPDFSVTQVCPEVGSDEPVITTVENADPLAWQVRIVFDELLDPDIETLTDSATGGPCTDDSETCDGHIEGSQPVNVTCNDVDVAYDGYYSPNGNLVSWPPGPSLVTRPIDFVPTGATCEITLNGNVTDKSGVAVPEDQRGPFEFALSSLALLGSDPEISDPVAEIPPDYVLALIFNSLIDDTSVSPSDITLRDDTADVDVPLDVVADGTALTIVAAAGDLTDGNSYTLTVPTGATFADIGGGTLTTTEDYVLEFTVVAP